MTALRTAIAVLLVTSTLQVTCDAPSTITRSDSLSSIFDEAFSTIQYENSLFDYLSAPTFDNLKAYLTTQGRYFIPLWCAGGLTFIFFICCCIQLCCFNCCGQQYLFDNLDVVEQKSAENRSDLAQFHVASIPT